MQMEIANPYVIMFDNGHGTETRIHPQLGDSYQKYGLLIADLIRHVARCFAVDEREVVEWVNREMSKPTTTIKGGHVTIVPRESKGNE